MRELPSHFVRVAETSEDIQRCMNIRKEVFIYEQGYDIRIETNEDDAESTHFLLLLGDNQAIGTVRVINSNGQLGRFAILKPYRGLGLGRPMIQAVHDYVQSEGGKEVWCQSQAGDPTNGGVDATGFYRRLGYVNRGGRYMKEGTEHQDMVISLIP
ncbi:uncharacterized protein IL334_000026 [Kwoniella shivajii]|uniref:N-acetyltransferase domain-containing protein n=1 Tax=Kwoniella shivajii TaxID=564305 RepID=A0ABZ1CN56_9TREE|nr:hypothetical protein IL334_000026 [Kwoniella shivajii]